MPYPLPLTRTEAYLAYKAGVIQQSDLKPSLAVPRNGIDAWLAYWTGLAEDYPKREDGTPHILQEEEAYIAYLCGVLDEYPEKCLRRVGAYLRYIISARWGRPDHPLNREELYLSLIKTQFIPSGDPSSDITIDGTTKAPFVDVKMYGDTFQQSYDGWNILDVDFESTTSYGVTKTLNADKTITLNGKINAGLNFTFGKNITFDTSSQYTLKVEVLRGSSTPYTNDGLPNHQWAVMVNMGLSSLGWQSYAIMCADDATTVTFTPAQATGTPRFWFGYNAQTSDETTGIFNDYTLRISVKKGTTISGYEPFVGGIASPNPDYPQPIQVVTGEQIVEVRGKNLFDIDNYSSAVLRGGGSALSVAKENATTLVLTNLVSQGSNFCGIPIPDSVSLLGKSVTISGTVTLGTGVSDARVAVYAGTSTSVATAIASKTLSASGSFTLAANIPASYPSGANLIHFVIYGSGNNSPTVNSTVVYSNLQMEIGSATAYAPYSKTDYPISLGSIELCKLGTYQDYIYKEDGDWKIHKATGRVTLNGTEDWYSSQSAIKALWVDNPDHTGLGVDDIYRGYTMDALNGEAYMNCAVRQTVGSLLNASKFGFGVRTENDSGNLKNAANALYVRFDGYTTVETVKQYFASHNAVLYYQLNVATDTTITDTSLIAQLEALVKGGSEEGTTYIKVSATDSNLPGLLYVEAAKYVE